MKLLFLLVTTALAGPLAFAQQPAELPLVTTTGSALIRVAPDLADLCFTVEVRNVDLAVARKEQAERGAKVLASLRGAVTAEADLQSSSLQIAPQYGQQNETADTVSFYRVTQTFSCTLHDVKKVVEVTGEAIAAGATGVYPASLRSSEFRKYRDQARLSAIHAANEKATALAGALGGSVGKPYSISEASSDQPGEGGSPAFASGLIEIDASVTVSFLLQ